MRNIERRPFRLDHEGFSRCDPIEERDVFRLPFTPSAAAFREWLRGGRLLMSDDGLTGALVQELLHGARQVVHNVAGVVGNPVVYGHRVRMLRVFPERVEAHVEDGETGAVVGMQKGEAHIVQPLDRFERSVDTLYGPIYVGRMQGAPENERRYVYHGRALTATTSAVLTPLPDRVGTVRVLDRFDDGSWISYLWGDASVEYGGSAAYQLPFRADRAFPIVGNLRARGRHELGYLTTTGQRGEMVFPLREVASQRVIPLRGWVEWEISSPRGNGWAMLLQIPGKDDIVPTRLLVVNGPFHSVSRVGTFSLNPSDFHWTRDGHAFVAKLLVHRGIFRAPDDVLVFGSSAEDDVTFGPFGKAYEPRIDSRGNLACVVEDALGQHIYLNGSITSAYGHVWNLRLRDGLLSCNILEGDTIRLLHFEA